MIVKGKRWPDLCGKISCTSHLFLDIFRRSFARIIRIVQHFRLFLPYLSSPVLYGVKLKPVRRIFLWLGELLFLLLDFIGIPEWYEMGSLWLKPGTRPLSDQELAWAKPIFGNTIPYRRIRIDERAHIGPRQYRFCYVSFCVINSWQAMSPAILIHELVHVWQFQRYGSPYILRALLAQRTVLGYDYGGIAALMSAKRDQLGFSLFNYEQQASIIEDFFRLCKQEPAHWAQRIPVHGLETYRYFVAALKNSHL